MYHCEEDGISHLERVSFVKGLCYVLPEQPVQCDSGLSDMVQGYSERLFVLA